jgi:hypothetical protein
MRFSEVSYFLTKLLFKNYISVKWTDFSKVRCQNTCIQMIQLLPRGSIVSCLTVALNSHIFSFNCFNHVIFQQYMFVFTQPQTKKSNAFTSGKGMDFLHAFMVPTEKNSEPRDCLRSDTYPTTVILNSKYSLAILDINMRLIINLVYKLNACLGEYLRHFVSQHIYLWKFHEVL